MQKKSIILYIFYIFVILFLIFIFFLLKNNDTSVIKVNKIEIEEKEVNIKYGDTYQINYEIEPKNATMKGVNFESNNKDVVYVDQAGKIVVRKNVDGEYLITISSKDGEAKETLKVIVEKTTNVVKVTKVDILEKEINLEFGKTIKINVVISPNNATNKNVIWKSSNNNIVKIDNNGNIEGKKEGIATITVRTIDGNFTDSVKVKVVKKNNAIKEDKKVKVTGIKLDKTSVSLKYGASTQLNMTIFPNNATNKNVTWTSSDTSLVTVDNFGKIVAVANKNGEAIITVKTLDGGYTSSAKVKVLKVETEIKVTGIKLDKTSVNLKYGETLKLNAIITPNNATNKNATWTSSDTSLVTVDNNGNIKASNKEGKAIITVKSNNGNYIDNCNVTITRTKVTGITLDKTSLNLQYGNTAKVNAIISPSNASNKNVTWTSSNVSLVTVDNNGNIKVVSDKDGTATITAKTNDGGYTAKLVVTVKKKTYSVTGIKLNSNSGTIYLNKTNTISLTSTITPSNATNKNVTWSSSNSSVATVNNGKITALKPGTADITVTTADGNYKATYKLTVKKKVIIIIGASQVTRMKKYKSNYTSTNYNYKTSDNTLVYVEKSGSGIDYQTGDGWTLAKKTINSYQNTKSQIDFYIFFPLSGNTIKKFVCGSNTNENSLGKISTTNSNILKYAKNYNNVINNIKNDGYNVKAYVVSMHPVKVSDSSSSTVVVNENKNSCAYDYRSNWKYFEFNKAIKSIIEKNYTSNLKYQSLFIKIMETSSEGKNKTPYNFSYKISYSTDDGVHWDEKTTNTYVNMMLDYSGDL